MFSFHYSTRQALITNLAQLTPLALHLDIRHSLNGTSRTASITSASIVYKDLPFLLVPPPHKSITQPRDRLTDDLEYVLAESVLNTAVTKEGEVYHSTPSTSHAYDSTYTFTREEIETITGYIKNIQTTTQEPLYTIRRGALIATRATTPIELETAWSEKPGMKIDPLITRAAVMTLLSTRTPMRS